MTDWGSSSGAGKDEATAEPSAVTTDVDARSETGMDESTGGIRIRILGKGTSDTKEYETLDAGQALSERMAPMYGTNGTELPRSSDVWVVVVERGESRLSASEIGVELDAIIGGYLVVEEVTNQTQSAAPSSSNSVLGIEQ